MVGILDAKRVTHFCVWEGTVSQDGCLAGRLIRLFGPWEVLNQSFF